MEANSLNNRTYKFCFACFKPNVKEHTCGIRVFKRASVAVKPRSKYNTVRPGRNCINNFFKIIIKVKFSLLKAVCRIAVFLKKYADFVKSKVVFTPADAFVRSFKLSKVVKCVRVSAYNSCNHSTCINSLLFNNCSYPA